MARHHHGLHVQARQVSLLRLLLLAVSVAVVVFFVSGRKPEDLGRLVEVLHGLLLGVAAVSALLVFAVSWARRRWQLSLHLVFDLLWIGMLLYFTGGVGSPGVVLLFAVVLIGNLVLPGVGPFVLPALASLVLAVNASLYLAGSAPFSAGFLAVLPDLVNTNRILGNLAIQVAALFLVDLLGQVLARRLHEQRIFTGELLDQLGEGVLAIDRQGLVAYVNAEAARLLDLAADPSTVQGRPVARLLTGAQYLPVFKLLTGPECPRLERFRVGERQLVVRVTGLLGRRQRPIGRTLLVADETRLQVLEENARRAEHLASLGEMAAGIAHEVRNPLTSLRGCAQEVAEICEKIGQPDAAALAGIMVTESDRIGRIVNDFLSLSRLRPPQRSALEIGPVLDEQRQLTGNRRDLPPGAVIEVSADEDAPLINADPDQIRQVLSNLINNAIDAVLATPQPRLACRATRVDATGPLGVPALRIAVTDNGCGIPEDLKERIFTPFFSTKAQGTGLGLSLVNRIVREHEGLVQVDSAPGAGTTVTVYLPAHSQTRTYMRALGHG